MLNKIYLIVLAVAVIVMGVFTYLSNSWLKSIGSPANVVENYKYFSNFGWWSLWFTTLILLLVGNVILWKTRKSWALWTSLLYFVFFIVVQTFWLEANYFQFKQLNNLTDSAFSLSPFIGFMLIVLMTIIVFFDHFIVKRLHEKMFSQPLAVEEIPAVTLEEK